MIKILKSSQIYLKTTSVDMRKAIDGLNAIINDEFERKPHAGDLFIFFNHGKNKVKIIYYDRNGFVMHYKRLDKGRFKIEKDPEHKNIELSQSQLEWLLAGLDFQLMQKYPEINYENYY